MLRVRTGSEVSANFTPSKTFNANHRKPLHPKLKKPKDLANSRNQKRTLHEPLKTQYPKMITEWGRMQATVGLQQQTYGSDFRVFRALGF